jgi:hypothetical protein
MNLLDLGDVYIVTNATIEWIKSCMNTCYPQLWKAHGDLLSSKLISARDEFEDMNPSDPTLWKSLTFEKILKSVKGFQSVFSIGDSQSERQALFSVVKYLNDIGSATLCAMRSL